MPYPWQPAIPQAMQQHGGRNRSRKPADVAQTERVPLVPGDEMPMHEQRTQRLSAQPDGRAFAGSALPAKATS